MLLNTRKAPADHPSGMNYEVIFGVAGEEVAVEAPALASGMAKVEKTFRLEACAQPPAAAPPACWVWSNCTSKSTRSGGLLVRSSQAQLTMQQAIPELADVYAHLDGG